jgi:GTP-binding protein
MAERRDSLKKTARKTPLVLSAVSGLGIKEALYALAREINRGTTSPDDEAETNQGWSP